MDERIERLQAAMTRFAAAKRAAELAYVDEDDDPAPAAVAAMRSADAERRAARADYDEARSVVSRAMAMGTLIATADERVVVADSLAIL